MKELIKFETKAVIDIPITKCDDCKKTLSSPFIESEKIYNLKALDLKNLYTSEYLYFKEFCENCYKSFLEKNYEMLKPHNENFFKKMEHEKK